MEVLNGFRLKQKTGVKPALSCFEFRAEGDFSPFVLFGGSREKHLHVLTSFGGLSSLTVHARTQKVLLTSGWRRWRGELSEALFSTGSPGWIPPGLVQAAGLRSSWPRGSSWLRGSSWTREGAASLVGSSKQRKTQQRPRS